MPPLSAISSNVGHGAPGTRHALRTLEDLQLSSAGQRHVWIELRPGWVARGTWTNVTGDSWTWTPDEWPTFDGLSLIPVQLEVASGTCERAASSAEVDATAGLFIWTSSSGQIRAQFPEAEDPNDETVVVRLGFFVGTAGVVHGWRGYERLTNSSLETWAGGSPSGWTSAGTATSLTELAEGAYDGTRSARVTLSSEASGNYWNLSQDISVVQDEWYELSGYYRGQITSGSAELRIVICDTGLTTYLRPDGVSSQGSGLRVLEETAETGGEWRHFTIYYKKPWTTGDTRHYIQVYSASASTSGTVDLDGISLRHIPHFVSHLPLLTLSGVPYIEASKADAFYGQTSSGIGDLLLANGNGYLEPLVGTYDWQNAPAILRVGGRLANAGNDVPASDWRTLARARVIRPVVRDGEVVLELEDQRTIMDRFLPLGTFNAADYSDLLPNDYGRPRGMFLGLETETTAPVGGIRPTLIEAPDFTNHHGLYEYCDPSFTSAGESGAGKVYAYETEDAATKEDSTRRVVLVSGATSGGPDFAQDARDGTGLGQLEILQPVAPIRITERNHLIDFNIGGSEITVGLGYGLWRPAYLWSVLEDGMNTNAGVSNISVTYDATNQKVVIARASGTLTLMTNTGSHRDVSFYPELGFDLGESNKSGAASYTGDNEVFAGAEDSILRVNASYGVCDDASGTYTGTAYKWLSYGSEIVHYLLRAVMKVRPDEIDEASFEDARSVPLRRLCAYYVGWGDESTTLGEIIERAETSSGADVRLVDGRWTWVYHVDSVHAGYREHAAIELEESDYLSFESYYNTEDLVGVCVLGLTPNPVTGKYQTGQVTKTELATRFDIQRQRTFFSMIHSQTEATGGGAPRVEVLARECQTKRRRFRFSVKGKLLFAPIGSQVVLTRNSGIGPTGHLSQVVARIIHKRDDLVRWTSDVEAIEVKTLRIYSHTFTGTIPAATDIPIARMTAEGTVIAVRALRVGGTSVTANAKWNSNALLASNITVSTADTWYGSVTIQNSAVPAGASLSVNLPTVSGTPTAVSVQIEIEE